MHAPRFPWATACVIVLLLFVASSTGCAQQPQAAQPRPAKAGERPRLDIGKTIVERPTEQLLASATTTTNEAAPTFVNPKVEPGKVKWHADFATARAASAKSGKPVLLFQLLGRLDEQFC